MHVGCYYSLAPEEEVVLSKEATYSPELRNPGQRVLNQYYNDAKKLCDQFEVDTVFLLGDLLDGFSPAERGPSMVNNSISAQEEMLLNLLEPLVTNRQTHLVSGSRYHESEEYKVYGSIAKAIKPWSKEVFYHQVVGNIKLRPTEKVFNIAHESTSGMLYTATLLDREQIYIKYAEALGKLPHIDHHIRGHLHKFYHIDTGYMHLTQVPAWKTWYPIKNKTGLYGRMQSDIGFVIILLDAKGRSYFKNFVWNAPHIADPLVMA
jgi:hypothetical protein